MIETGNPECSPVIKTTWKKSVSGLDQRYIEYFFRNIYQPEFGFALMEGDKAPAALFRIPHVMMFNGRAIKVSMLSGISELPEKRREEPLGKLLDVVLDACEHTELITLAEENELLKPYGFETVYRRAVYKLTRDTIKRITNFGCAYDPSPLDMLKVYSSFIRRFNGFYAREIQDFVQLKKEIAARGGKVVAFYNSKNQIQGYATILLTGNEAIVEECVYMNSVALAKLVNAALQERITVHMHVTDAEDLHVLYPEAERVEYGAVMARLNAPDLFSRLFSQQITTAHEAFAMSYKPLFLNERY